MISRHEDEGLSRTLAKSLLSGRIRRFFMVFPIKLARLFAALSRRRQFNFPHGFGKQSHRNRNDELSTLPQEGDENNFSR